MNENECYLIINWNGIIVSHNLPCYPEEISESQTADWPDAVIVKRSSPLSSYTNTGYREVSFSFDLHREMVNGNISEIETILQDLRKTIYPEYTETGFIPPITTFAFGEFKVRGIVKSLNFVWKKPIIDFKYNLCTVSISISDVPDMIYNAHDLGLSMNPFNITQ